MEPPGKDSQPTKENIEKLERWLTSIIAGHPGAKHTYTFYEEIDKYLGPWGEEGYPIGYGKRYNILFTTNTSLRTDIDVQQWVWKTTIKLQEELRDFIVRIYRERRLYPMANEYWIPRQLRKEIRDAAFNSHPKAYVNGGLTIVAITAPDMIRHIAKIPQTEFSPLSPNFKASVQQVLATIERVTGEATGVTLASLSGPAHTRSLQHAHQRDMKAVSDQRQALEYLNRLRGAIQRRELDSPGTLEEIIKRLNARQFSDMGTAKLARDVVRAAQIRKNALSHTHKMEVYADPSLRTFYNKRLEGWER